MNEYPVRAIQASDRDWVAGFVKSRRGSEIVVAKGRVIRPVELDSFAVVEGKEPVFKSEMS